MTFGDYDTSRKVIDLAREELAKEKMKLGTIAKPRKRKKVSYTIFLDAGQRYIKLEVTPDDDDDGMDTGADDAPVDQFPPVYFFF